MKRKLEEDTPVVRHVYESDSDDTTVHVSTDAAWALQVRTKIRALSDSEDNRKGGFVWSLLGLLHAGEYDDECFGDVPHLREAWDWFVSTKPATAIDEWMENPNLDEGPFESITFYHSARQYDLINGDTF